MKCLKCGDENMIITDEQYPANIETLEEKMNYNRETFLLCPKCGYAKTIKKEIQPPLKEGVFLPKGKK